MTLAITKEHIPLKLLATGGIDVDIERLNVILSRAITVPRDITLPLIEAAVTDANFPISNMNELDESVTGLVRLIKTYSRPITLKYGLADSGLAIINPKDYYNKEDIISSYTFTSYLHAGKPGTPFIEVTGVAFSLMRHGFLKEDERAEFGNQVSDFIVNHKNWTYANLTSDRFVFEERVRDIAEIFIDNFIFSRWYMKYLDDISDSISAPYFKVNEDLQIGLESNDKLTMLLIALGFATINDLDSDEDKPFEEILEKLTIYIRDKMLGGVPEDSSDDLIDEMSRLINLNFLNALYINAIDGKKDPKSFDYSAAHNITFSQAEIEHYFLDTAVSIMRPDSIREALHEVTGLPLSGLQDATDQIHETLVKVFNDTIKQHYDEPYRIFHAIVLHLSIELQAYVKKLEESN